MKFFLTIVLSSACLLSACSNSSDNIVQGYVEGDLIYFSSSQSGALATLNINRGQNVNANELLFSLDSQPQSFQLAQANAELASEQATLKDLELGLRPDEIEEIEADIASTQAAITYFEKETKRYEDLSKLNYASKSAYDDKLYQYQQNVAQLKKLQASLRLGRIGDREYKIAAQKQKVTAAAANVESLQWNNTQKTVSTNIAGQIFDTYYKPGEWITAGQAVASLQTPENIYIIFFVGESQLGAVQIGSKVAFQCDDCKNPISATINYISSEAEYSPPVIYSENMREKLVYEVRAAIPKDIALQYHSGQPVDVALNGKF